MSTARGIWIGIAAGCIGVGGCADDSTLFGTAPTGGFRTRLPRPDDGSPYAIYRLLTGAGDVVSAPILVRAKR